MHVQCVKYLRNACNICAMRAISVQYLCNVCNCLCNNGGECAISTSVSTCAYSITLKISKEFFSLSHFLYVIRDNVSARVKRKMSVGSQVRTNVQNNHLWILLKTKTGIDLPLPLKILLHFFGYDSAASLQSIQEETFDEMQEFARSELSSMITEEDDAQVYFGIYASRPDKFIIPKGNLIFYFLVWSQTKTADLVLHWVIRGVITPIIVWKYGLVFQLHTLSKQ